MKFHPTVQKIDEWRIIMDNNTEKPKSPGRFDIPRPACLLEAQNTGKPRSVAAELLIFFLVFFVYNMISSIIVTGPTMAWFFSNQEIREIFGSLASGEAVDMTTMLESFNSILSNMPAWLMLLQLIVTAAGIATALFYCVKFEKRRAFTLGFTKKSAVSEYLIGLGAGFVAFSAAVLICVLFGGMRLSGLNPNCSPLIIVLFFFGFAVQGMSEEVLCRGYLMVTVAKRRNIATAIGVSAVVFGLLHAPNNGLSWLAVVNLILFGVFAAIYFLKRGNIWGVAAFHAVWNFTQGNLYGLPVSGMSAGSSVLSVSVTENLQLVNGGVFGLEGGIAVTIVLAAGTLILCLIKPKNVTE